MINIDNIQSAKYIACMDKDITIKVTQEDDTIAWVPINTANTDYQTIQEWAKTNTIEEAD
jgi:hypothetical protein|tara:strand:+ start:353 stop:532 length:180 start_codon:yes stop_codon:yes gene_type:complete